MNGGVPRDPDTAPTLGPGDADDSKGGEGPDRARATLFRHAGSDAPAGVPDTLKPPAPEGSVVHALRSHLGVRAEADLPGGPEPEKDISGPASERRYNEGREIARGGMGAILELFDRDIRRPVAMKVMLHERNADRVGRFIEEAQVTGQLEHPNIVPVHEIGIGPRGRIYFTMKLVQGESLQARIDRNAGLDPEEGEPTPLPEMLRIFLKVCDAVAFAHSRGVVHRDLKPDNVMVGKFGEVLVMDWGLAKVRGRPDAPAGGGVSSVRSGETGSRTLDGSVVGTPAYMPPEQADGKTEEIDERSDLWALGGILYSVLCHEAPYAGDMMANVLAKAVEGSVVPPRLRSPHLRVPAELEAVCLKAMAPAKADRYASAEALAADVLAFLDRRLVSAYRYGPLERVARWVQRHPTASTAGGVAAILVILGTFLTVSTVQEKRIADLKAAEAERGKQEAVQAKDAAEDKARTATDLLEKGRRVSAVLRSAWLDLSEAAGEIEASYFSADGTAARRRTYERRAPEIEAFARGVPGDPASRSAWLALQGLLKSMGGAEEEGLALFRASREADPDVVIASLFEAAIVAEVVQSRLDYPTMVTGPEGIRFLSIPFTNEGSRKARREFDGILARLRATRVWGESTAADFGEVVQGYLALQENRPAEAERHFTRVLRIPEMSWMSVSLRLSRSLSRYFQKDFAGARADVAAILERAPRYGAAHNEIGNCLWGEGLEREGKGEDGRPDLARSLEAFDRAVKLEPAYAPFRINRGLARLEFGHFRHVRGEDPRDLYLGAVQDFTDCLGIRDLAPHVLANRAGAWTALGLWMESRGEDALEAFGQARKDGDAALWTVPDLPGAYLNRGLARAGDGRVRAARGEDAGEAFEAAAEDFRKAILLDPEDAFARNNLAVAKMGLSEAAGRRGRDPKPALEDALRDLEDLARRHPRFSDVHNNLCSARKRLADVLQEEGKDPRPLLAAAAADAEKAAALRPGSPGPRSNLGLVRAALAVARAKAGEDPRDDWRAAVAAHGESLKADPGLFAARNNRALAWWYLGEAEDLRGEDPQESYLRAAEDFSACLAADARSLRGRASRAQVWRDLGRARRARGLDPRAAFRRSVEDYAEALRSSLLRASEAAETCLDLGLAEDAWGADGTAAFVQALAHFSEAEAKESPAWPHAGHAGVTLMRIGRWAEAAARLEAALEASRGAFPPLKLWLERARAGALDPVLGAALLRAENFLFNSRYPEARDAYEAAVEAARASKAEGDPRFAATLGIARYNLACALSLLSAGRKAPKAAPEPVAAADAEALRAKAVEHLRACFRLGFVGAEQARADEDLAALRGRPDFEALLREGGK